MRPVFAVCERVADLQQHGEQGQAGREQSGPRGRGPTEREPDAFADDASP